MAKGPIITDAIKWLIAEVYLGYPDWRAKEVQHEVNRKLGSHSPGLSAVQKELTKIRRRGVEIGPDLRDQPWNLGTLTKYDLPPEAIPIILVIQERKRLNNEKPLTIREAWWVSRLRCLVSPPKVLSIAEVLSLWASSYASSEQVARLTNTELDTSDLDQIIIGHAEEYAAYPFTWYGLQRTHGYDEAATRIRHLLELRCRLERGKLSQQEMDTTIELYAKELAEIEERTLEGLTGEEREQIERLKKELAEIEDGTKEAQNERSHSQEVQE